MRPKSIILLVLALGCGLIASIGINQVLANRGTTVIEQGETESIFVALEDIGLGKPLTPQNIKLEAWPKDKVPEGAMTDLEEVEGRRTRTKMFAGEPILEAKLLNPGTADHGATALIPKGHRVVSVRVDAVTGGSSLILPGDRVDVLVHLVRNEGRGITETGTRTILQDIKVFAVNSTFSREPELHEEAAIAAKTISLLVTPEQAELVMLATEMGEIRLAMRSPEDDQLASTTGANVNRLLGTESEKSDREDESLMDEDEQSSDQLLSFLNEEQEQADQEAPKVAAREVGWAWKMILLEGTEARELGFDEKGGLPVELTADKIDREPEEEPAEETTDALSEAGELKLPWDESDEEASDEDFEESDSDDSE